jgi:type I restriction enzyme S subunit
MLNNQFIETNLPYLGKIPSHWDIGKYKFANEVIMGQSPDSKDYVFEPNDYPFLQGNAEFGEVSPTARIWCEKANKASKKNDILISVRAPIGAINISDQEYGIGRGLAALRGRIHISKFLYYYFQSLNEYLNSLGTGSTFTAISTTTLKDVFLPFISLPEQTQITKYLDYQTDIIDQLIQKKEKLVELLQEQQQAIINEAVTKGLDPNAKMKDSGIEWLGEIPEEWELIRLKFLATYFLSSVGRNTNPDDMRVKICHYPNAYKNEIIDNHTKLESGTCTQDQYDSFRLKKGQIVITKDSESADDIGVPCYIAEDIENGICGYHLGTIECTDSKIIPKFLFRFFQTTIVSSFFELTVNGITRFGLGKPTVENLYIPLPTIEEQKQIISKVEQSTKRIDLLSTSILSQIQKLKEYRQSIISEAVTGKIDLREWKAPKKEIA